ncbi:MAG: hypothetical protein SPL03_07545 [Succinivibrio dextrinosolvens]|nr:hypothetical protein [Succinivibrio dextrinosolvens]
MSEIQDKRLKKINEERSTYEVHFRLSKEDYTELRLRAAENGMKLSEYVRKAIFSDRNRKLNTDFELFQNLTEISRILKLTGNYMVKIRSVMDGEDYTLATKLKEGMEAEVKNIDILKKIILSYMSKAKTK